MSSISEIQSSLSHLNISEMGNINKYENTYVHWHFIDISHNYFNDKINWAEKGIILNDDKYFTLYNIENLPYINFPTSRLIEILQHNNSKYLTVKNVINYFNDVYIHIFKNEIVTFLKWDKNPEKFASKIKKINHIGLNNNEPFIIVPTGKYNIDNKYVISFAIINVSTKMMKYITSGSNYKNAKHYKKNLMLNLISGLTNHFNINGIITSTSFNLYKAFLKYYQTKKYDDTFKFLFNLENKCFDKDIQLYIILNHINAYFPKLQVIWSSFRRRYSELDKNITEDKNGFKGHDVLFKHNEDNAEDNEKQKRRAIKFHPYSRNKHIKDDMNLLNKKKNSKLKVCKSKYNKDNKDNDDNYEFLTKIGISDLSIDNSF